MQVSCCMANKEILKLRGTHIQKNLDKEVLRTHREL